MKLIITENQFKKILIYESNEVKFNFDLYTILSFAKLIGIKLKGQNEFLVNRHFKDKNVVTKIYKILSNKQEYEKMLDDLSNKGLLNAENKIIDNIEKIIDGFNKISDEKLSLTKVINELLH